MSKALYRIISSTVCPFRGIRNITYSQASAKLAECRDDDMTTVDHLVVGAGVIGLAVARQLALKSPNNITLLVDKNQQFGMETSSRNSEVIHGGIYYPKDSLRTRLCIDGKVLMYDYCKRNSIPFKKIGKLVVAQNDEQMAYLHRLAMHCSEIGVPSEILSKDATFRMEPNVHSRLALHSPTTGIVDSHLFMESLKKELLENGADFAPNSEVLAIQHDRSGYRVMISTKDPATPYMCIRASTLVNAAGLWADRITSMLADQTMSDWSNKYRLYFAKGRYYLYVGGSKIKVQRLIYPVPDKHVTSLGTHLTIDMGGAIRFGPDLEWVKSNSDYSFKGSVQSEPSMSDVSAEISRYLPAIKAEDLVPGYTGIRPKLQPPGGSFRDFVVKEESEAGFPGFVNLIGIESPGLTSSLAIATMVAGLL